MADAADYMITWGFMSEFDRGYLGHLLERISVGGVDGLELLDRLFEKYGVSDLTRAAVRAAWDFRGPTQRVIPLSPEALEAAFRFMVVTHESGAGLSNREQILRRMLSCWGKAEAPAKARAEAQLLEIAGTDVSDHQLVIAFLKVRQEFVKNRERPTESEARAYFKKYRKRGAFAANRFGATLGAAAAFVDALYEAGAAKVVIENISYDHEAGEGGPHADSMVVQLPAGGERRQRIFDIINNIGKPEDAPLADDGGDDVNLWWD